MYNWQNVKLNVHFCYGCPTGGNSSMINRKENLWFKYDVFAEKAGDGCLKTD